MNQEPSATNNARKNYFNWTMFYRFAIGSFVMRLLMDLKKLLFPRSCFLWVGRQ